MTLQNGFMKNTERPLRHFPRALDRMCISSLVLTLVWVTPGALRRCTHRGWQCYGPCHRSCGKHNPRVRENTYVAYKLAHTVSWDTFIRGDDLYCIQMWGRTESSAPNVQTHFWFVAQTLFLPHLHVPTLAGIEDIPTHTRQAKPNIINIFHKPQLSASQLQIALVGSPKCLWSLQ